MGNLISPSRRRSRQTRSCFKEFILHRRSRQRGLTRLEVVAVLAALGLLACVALPALANTRNRSERVGCMSNLRQVGQALHAWASSHGDRVPWLTPWTEEGTYVPAGGTPLPIWYGLQNQAYFQYSWVSNELVSPKYLVCPADSSKVVARNWGSGDPTGGFRHGNFRDNAVSYTISLHAWPERTEWILSGDRNFGYDALVSSCSTHIMPAREIRPATTIAGWQGTIHGTNGNILLYDGRVEQVDTPGLRRVFLKYLSGDNDAEHFIHQY